MRIAILAAIASTLCVGSAFASVKLNNLTPQVRMNMQQSTKVRQTVDTSFGAKLKSGLKGTAKAASTPTKTGEPAGILKNNHDTLKGVVRRSTSTSATSAKAQRKGSRKYQTISNAKISPKAKSGRKSSRKYQTISNAIKAAHQTKMNSVRNMK